jgi:hypothetical protein
MSSGEFAFFSFFPSCEKKFFRKLLYALVFSKVVLSDVVAAVAAVLQTLY